MSRKFDQLSPEDKTARYGEFAQELERVWKNLDKLGVPRNIDLTGNIGDIRKQVEDNIQALERQRLEMERLQKNKGVLRGGFGDTAHVDEFRKFQAEQLKGERELRNSIRGTADAQVVAFRNNQQERETLFKLEKAMAVEVAGFDKERLTARAAMEAKANEMVARAMPLEHARAKLGKETVEIQKWRAAGIIDEIQKTALLADAQKRLNIIETAHARTGGRFTRSELTNVSYQLNDIVTMAASGANFSQILATQGPQLFQIVQGAGGEGGLVGGFKNLSTAIGALISPTTLAVGALVTGAGAAMVAWTGFDNSVKSLQRSLMGLGRSTNGTLDQLMNVTDQVAAGTNLSRREARTTVGAFAGTGRIDPSLYVKASDAAEDLAIVTGTDLPEASQALAKALADPLKGIQELDEQFNLFSDTELKAAQRMAASGNLFGAQTAILQGLEKSIGGATKTLSGFEQMTKRIGDVAGTAWDQFGQDVAKLFGFQSLEDEFKVLEEQIKAIQALRDKVASSDQAEPFKSDALESHEAKLAELEKRAGEVRAEMDKLTAGGAQARADLMGKQIAAMAQGWEPFEKQIRDVNTELEKLRRQLGSDEWRQLTPEARQNLDRGIQFNEARQKRQQMVRPYGGEEGFNQVRDTQFAAATAGITEFGRALAQIDHETKKRIEALQAEGPVTDEQTRRINALKQARENEIEALQRSTAMSLGRSTAPEMFELGDLQNQLQQLEGLRETMKGLGMTAEQIDHVLDRARAAIQNYQTYAQRLAEDYKLQQQEIAAVTFEQKAAVEAERARVEAIRAGRTELEAAAAAEAARNNALAKSQRQGWEALRDAREQAGMVGLKPMQRDQAEIGGRYERMRTEQGDSEYLRNAEALEKWAAAQEAIRGPLEESNNELNDQIRLTAAAAQGYGGMVGDIEAAAEAQRLMNEYLRAGVQITPELTQAIQTYAQRAGQLKQVQYAIREQQETFADLQDMGKDALKGFISDLKEGKSAGEAFLNVLERMVDRILDMMINSLFDPNSQKGFNIFGVLQGLFTGKMPGAGVASALPSTMTTPFGGANGYALPPAPGALNAPMPQLSTYGSPGINAAIAGSVPTFKQTSTAISNLGSAAGQTTQSFDSFTGNLSAAAKAIRTIESGSPEGDYGSLGKVIQDPRSSYFGDRAYGAYQVMGKNVPQWTQQHYGTRLTPSQFIENPSAQDAVFRGEFGGYMQKYGAEGAARMWYGGPSGLRNFKRADVTSGGQNTGQYGSRFGRLYEQHGGGAAAGAGAGATAAPQIEQLGTAAETTSQSFQNVTPHIDQFGQGFTDVTRTMDQGGAQLQQSFSQVPSMVGEGGQQVSGALQNTAGVIGQGANGVGGALDKLSQTLSSAGGGGGGGGLGGIGKMLGGMAGGVDWSSWTSNTASWTLPSDFSMTFHEGGRVGGGGGRARPMTAADHIAFMMAPRFHSGTKGALKHDERRAILQTDEEVLNRREAADYRSGKGQGGNSGMTVLQPQVNIINPPSEPETRTNADGSVDVIFDQFEGRMAERAKHGRGPLVKAIGGRREGNALIG